MSKLLDELKKHYLAISVVGAGAAIVYVAQKKAAATKASAANNGSIPTIDNSYSIAPEILSSGSPWGNATGTASTAASAPVTSGSAAITLPDFNPVVQGQAAVGQQSFYVIEPVAGIQISNEPSVTG